MAIAEPEKALRKEAVLLVVVVLVLALMLALAIWHERLARRELTDWAAREGYEILSRQRGFRGGPFWWRKLDPNSVVYKVAVRVSKDRTRTGYACCRPNIIFGPPVIVIWDD